MSRHSLRPIAVMLSFLVLTAGSAQANPIRFADVITQAVASGTGNRQTFDLRLRPLPQDTRTSNTGTPTQTPATSNTSNSDQTQTPVTPSSGNGSVTNTEVQTTPNQGGNVETVQVGDVTGTVCDCGPIITPGGSFPKLPFLALGGIPLLFIKHHNTPPPEFPTPPPPPPPPPQVPEPTTLLLLGSGLVALGAGARRRRARHLRHTVELPSAGEV